LNSSKLKNVLIDYSLPNIAHFSQAIDFVHFNKAFDN